MLRLKIIIGIVLAMVHPTITYAHAAEVDSLGYLIDRETVPDWYDFVGNLPHDFGAFACVVVDSKSVPVIVGLTAVTLGLVASDRGTYKYSRRVYERSSVVASASDFLVSVGDGRSSLIAAGAFAAYGLAASDRRAIRTASQAVEALLATGLLVQTFKRISGRESPSVATKEGGRWRPFPSFKEYNHHQSEYHAFPSGHIATTMATVTVLAENYPEQGWIRPIGYSLVGLVGISLVNYRWHWYSDLPLGIAIGYTFGRIVAHPGSSDEVDSNEAHLKLAPMMNEYGGGVQVSMRF